MSMKRGRASTTSCGTTISRRARFPPSARPTNRPSGQPARRAPDRPAPGGTMKKIAALIIALAAAPALAKLPPPSPEAAAKAKETAAKAAWSGKMDAFRLCRVQDEVAATYFERAKAAGKTTRAPMATPECKDPGPFVYNAE